VPLLLGIAGFQNSKLEGERASQWCPLIETYMLCNGANRFRTFNGSSCWSHPPIESKLHILGLGRVKLMSYVLVLLRCYDFCNSRDHLEPQYLCIVSRTLIMHISKLISQWHFVIITFTCYIHEQTFNIRCLIFWIYIYLHEHVIFY